MSDFDFVKSKPLAVILTLLCALFIVYGSWLPFQLSGSTFESAWLQLSQQQDTSFSKVDFGTNVLLAIPLAFFAAAWLYPLPAWLIRYPLILLGCLLLALVVELGQLLLVGRVASPYDVIAQGLGAVLGLLLWQHSGRTFWPLLCNLGQEVGRGTVWFKLALFYGLIFFIYNVLPLDLTLSPEGVYDKWKAGKIALVPFQYKDAPGFQTLYSVVSDFLVWLPLSYFVLRASHPRQPAVLYICLYSLLTEFVQFIVLSRVTDSSDVIYALLAVSLLKICQVKRHNPQTLVQQQGGKTAVVAGRDIAVSAQLSAGSQEAMLSQTELPQHTMQLKLPSLLACWAAWNLVLLVMFWYPFDFTTAHLNPHITVNSWFSLPFIELFRDSMLEAVTTMLQKVVLFAPLGWLLFMLKTRLHPFWLAVAAVLMLAQLVMIEVGQLFLVGRVSNLTDILIGLAAMAFAFVVSKHFYFDASQVASIANHKTDQATQTNPATSNRVKPAQLRFFIVGGVKFILTVIFFIALSQQSFVPYNLRELLGQGAVGQAVLVTIALFFCFSFWSFWLRSFPSSRLIHLLPLLFLHSQVFFWLLYFAVPLEVLQDVVGASHWQSLPELDMALRFSALLLILQLPLLLNAILVGGAKRKLLPFWIILLPVALIVWHGVVVIFAITDNITELLADGGSWLSSIFLWLWLHVLLLCSHWLGTLISDFKLKVVAFRLSLILVCTYSSFGLLSLALESNIYKYGKTFSALQFLLSPDRDSYLSIQQLQFNYYAVVIAFVIAVNWCDRTETKNLNRDQC